MLGCAQSLRTNADDRLPGASLGRVEGRNGIVEGRDVTDVRPQSSVSHPLDDLTQLATIGLDNEVDRQAVRGPRRGVADIAGITTGGRLAHVLKDAIEWEYRQSVRHLRGWSPVTR